MIDRRSVIKFKEKEDRYWSLLGSLQIFQSSWACLVMLLRKSGTSSCFENLLVTLRLMFELIKASVGSRFHELLEKFFSSGDDISGSRLDSLFRVTESTEERLGRHVISSGNDAGRHSLGSIMAPGHEQQLLKRQITNCRIKNLSWLKIFR